MSRFIRPQHPKASLTPNPDAMARVLRAGLAGQLKANGHRLQAHISKDGELVPYTRQGQRHTAPLPTALRQALLDTFRPHFGWTVVDLEWQKQQGILYAFDLLRFEDKLLDTLNYAQRHEMLSSFKLSPVIRFLPLLWTLDECLAVIQDPSPFTEGLVFRNVKSIGFGDGAIVRCRKSGTEFVPLRTRNV